MAPRSTWTTGGRPGLCQATIGVGGTDAPGTPQHVAASVAEATAAHCRGVPGYGVLLQLDRLEVRRQHDLEHLAIVRIVEDLVLHPRRLDPARALPHRDRALPFQLRFDRALEHVYH